MQYTTSLLALAALAAPALATVSTAELCSTHFGTTTLKAVPTTTYVVNQQETESIISTVIPTTTITPSVLTIPYTSIVLQFETFTEPQNTETFTALQFLTNTNTISTSTTVTSIKTIATTTVTLYGTTTVTTPAGFTPVASDTDYVAKRSVKSTSTKSKAKVTAAHVQLNAKNDIVIKASASYPQSVVCDKYLETVTTTHITKTGAAVRTTAPTPTITSTAYVTQNITVDVQPTNATATVTRTIVSDVNVTSTHTVNSVQYTVATVQVAGPQETFLAACAANNLVASANNAAGIDNIGYNPDTTNVVAMENVTSAYDCYAACQTAPDCAGSFYLSSQEACMLLTQATCGQGDAGEVFYTNGTVAAGSAFTVSNGACGVFANGGADASS